MPLGSPAVTPIRERSEIALRIDQIRQRLAALDAEVTRLASVADSSSVSVQVSALAGSSVQILQRLSALELALGASDVVTLAAGEAISPGQVIVPGTPGTCIVADPSDPLARNSVLGVAANGGAVGQSISIQRRGQMTIAGAAFESGRPVYLGLGGTITQDPTYAAAAVIVGVAMSATVIWVSAGTPTLLQPINYMDVFDDATPVSWGTVAPYIRILEALLARPNGVVVLVDGELDSTGTLSGL